MQESIPKPLLSLGLLLLFLTSLLVNIASAQEKPPVPEQYQKYFVHYVDERSIWDRVLNAVGLTSRDIGRSFALIAGVSDYPNMPLLDKKLNPAAEDIRRLEKYLKEYEFFDEIVVLKNADVTYDNLAFFLQSYFPERLKRFPKSRFLFAYSGHGMTEDSNGYLLKNTAQGFKDMVNVIPLKVIRDLFDRVVEHGHHVLVLLNACYSGAFLKRTFGDKHFVPEHSGAHAITAGGSDELTWHVPEIGSGSIFFEKFFAGLDGRADIFPRRPDGTSGDGLITVDELATYLKLEIQIFTDQKQNPQDGDISKDGSKGGFFFLNRQRQIAQGVLPEWIPERATPMGIDAEKLLIKGKTYYMLGEYSKTLTYFQQAAEAGNTEAMNNLGLMYAWGAGVEKNYQEAFHWFRRAAETGYAMGMANLGLMYKEGWGVEKNDQEAVNWFSKAAEAGDEDGMNRLGFMYLNGLGVEKNYQEAARWFRKAAEAGSAKGMANLGLMYKEGWGVEKNDQEAVNWFRKAAEAGDEDGMNRLGFMYDNGLGVEKNDQEAVRWYRRAAEAGNTVGMNNLGVAYLKGKGVEKNDEEAVNWFRKAAEAGNATGMFYLGMMYETGRGVEKNYKEALLWYREAASLGLNEAIERLRELGVEPPIEQGE